MFGLIAYRTEEKPPEQVVDGVRFHTVQVAEGQGPRARLSARAAASALRRGGVHLALFPPEYPLIQLFARRGVVPPPSAPLFRAAAPAIVRRYMRQRGVDPRAAMVAFAAERITPELCRCVTELCGEIRYPALCVPEGGESLALSLRRNFGAAVRVGTVDALPRPDLFVTFDDTPVPGEALCLDETLDIQFDDPRPVALLALLYRAGALDADALSIKTLTRRAV